MEAEIVDLADQGLPIFDEEVPPGAGKYEHERSKPSSCRSSRSTALDEER